MRWKIEIPGKGRASPIVWGDRVFVSTAIPTGQQVETQESGEDTLNGQRIVRPVEIQSFTFFAIERKSGATVWQRTVRRELPHEGTHIDGSWASSSPVTDGERVYAYFGSRGLYCFDLEGVLQWEKDLGDMSTRLGFGEGSSPVLHGDKIVVNWDHEGESFITALDKKTGRELWKVERDEDTSWSTPIVVEDRSRPQVVTTAASRVRSYDLETGEMIWECSGAVLNRITSPVAGRGLAYVLSDFEDHTLLAIRLAGARGDITGSAAVAWKRDIDTPWVSSPLLYGDALYCVKANKGIFFCLHAETGRDYYSPQRLEGVMGMYTSPVGAKGRVYFAGRDGTTVVVRHGPEFEVLARNSLDDGFDASPAIAGSELYLRGRKFLYCIARD